MYSSNNDIFASNRRNTKRSTDSESWWSQLSFPRFKSITRSIFVAVWSSDYANPEILCYCSSLLLIGVKDLLQILSCNSMSPMTKDMANFILTLKICLLLVDNPTRCHLSTCKPCQKFEEPCLGLREGFSVSPGTWLFCRCVCFQTHCLDGSKLSPNFQVWFVSLCWKCLESCWVWWGWVFCYCQCWCRPCRGLWVPKFRLYPVCKSQPTNWSTNLRGEVPKW